MTTRSATLKIHIPALVPEPRGAVAAAAVMVLLLRGITSVMAILLVVTKGRAVTAPAATTVKRDRSLRR